MVTRAERTATDPDLGVLAGRLLFAVQRELFTTLAARGFGDLNPRHGAVLAHLDPMRRARDRAVAPVRPAQADRRHARRRAGSPRLRRAAKPDPSDRRAKLIRPTARGLDQMRTADAIMADMQRRHAQRLGAEDYARFKRMFTDITEEQRAFVAE